MDSFRFVRLLIVVVGMVGLVVLRFWVFGFRFAFYFGFFLLLLIVYVLGLLDLVRRMFCGNCDFRVFLICVVL